MLGLLARALQETPDVALKAALKNNTEVSTHPDIGCLMYPDDPKELDMAFKPVQVDFGGILPYYPRPSSGTLEAVFTFTWSHIPEPNIPFCNRAKIIYLPFMTQMKPTLQMVSPGMEQVGDTRLKGDTLRWFTDWSTGIYDAMLEDGKLRFVIVMDSMENLDKSLFQLIDTALIDLIEGLSGVAASDRPGLSRMIEKFLEVLTTQVKLTTISQCQTNVNEPQLVSLGYTEDVRAKVTKLLARRDESLAQGRANRSQNEAVHPSDTSASERLPPSKPYLGTRLGSTAETS